MVTVKEGIDMSRKRGRGKVRSLQKRVVQSELPREDFRRPKDWSAWEARAREQLESSAASIDRPRRVRDRWGNLVYPHEV